MEELSWCSVQYTPHRAEEWGKNLFGNQNQLCVYLHLIKCLKYVHSNWQLPHCWRLSQRSPATRRMMMFWIWDKVLLGGCFLRSILRRSYENYDDPPHDNYDDDHDDPHQHHVLHLWQVWIPLHPFALWRANIFQPSPERHLRRDLIASWWWQRL